MKLKKHLKNRNPRTLNMQLRLMLYIIIIPFLAMVGILLFMLVSYNQEYIDSLQNANTASEFGNEFKQDIDAAMVYHVISGKSVDELPMELVDKAKDVIERMQKTTTLDENKKRIDNMLNLCERLRDSMVKTAKYESYNARMQSLSDSVFQFSKLLQSDMNSYVYDELNELSIVQKRIQERTTTAIFVVVAVSIILIIVILLFSLRFSNWLTQPIKLLCQKIKRLGDGDFTVSRVESSYIEIRTLDDGFNEMVGRINELLERKKKDQEALHRAELELLQAQINPHFLYNTFDSIIWLAETGCVDESIQMVTNLSNFFRNSLSKGQDVITLAVEEKQVCSYLEIQKIRYSDIMEYEIDFPENLLVYSIPKLTIQPLVENAIYHGIKSRRGKGKITIKAWEQDGDILITVHDNGNGMSPEKLEELRKRTREGNQIKGLGLVNVHRRLKLYCGEQYGLSFDSIPEKGTTVTIRIPKKLN